LDSDDAWHAPLSKIRSPYEFVVATGRCWRGFPMTPVLYLNSLNLLVQPLWRRPGQWISDTKCRWAAPEGVEAAPRCLGATGLASRHQLRFRDLLRLVAADAASADTRRTIERAESRQQALALLLIRRNPEEMTMDCCESLTSPSTRAARCLLGGDVVRGLGLFAGIPRAPPMSATRG